MARATVTVLAMMALRTLSFAAMAEEPCGDHQSEPIFSEAGTSEEEVRAFLEALQAAVAADERKRVVSMVEYPIEAWAGDREVTFEKLERLLAAFDRVFTARLKRTISGARVQCLFTNSEGVMIHDGEVWFGPVDGGGLKIVKINGPIGQE